MKYFLRIVLILSLTGVVVVFFVLDPEKYVIFPKCTFHSLTGYYCPGCGSQRAIHNLLHLNFAGVVGNNLLFLPAFLLVFYHYVHRPLNSKFKFKLPNLLYYKLTPWILFGIIILFWALRNIPVYPFTLLAPD